MYLKTTTITFYKNIYLDSLYNHNILIWHLCIHPCKYIQAGHCESRDISSEYLPFSRFWSVISCCSHGLRKVTLIICRSNGTLICNLVPTELVCNVSVLDVLINVCFLVESPWPRMDGN